MSLLKKCYLSSHCRASPEQLEMKVQLELMAIRAIEVLLELMAWEVLWAREEKRVILSN